MPYKSVSMRMSGNCSDINDWFINIRVGVLQRPAAAETLSGEGVANDVEQQLLTFHNRSPNSPARQPPPIGFERRVPGGADDDDLSRLHRAAEYPPDATGVIRCRHENDGSHPIRVTPRGQDFAFVLGSADGDRNALDGVDPEAVELPDLEFAALVWDASPNQLQVHEIWRVGENSNAAGDAGAHEVGSLEHAGPAGVDGDHDDVDRRDRIVGDERPAPGAKNSTPRREQAACGTREHKRHREKTLP